MQKKVIAAVIGGLLIAPAAFADVTISGRLSAGLESSKLSDGTRAYNNELRMSDQSSSVIFKGSEDLGGGLSAWFQIDNRFDFTNGQNQPAGVPTATFAPTGNTQIGLKGGFGTLAIGRTDIFYNEMFRYDAGRSGSLQTWVTGAVFSQVNGSPVAATTRWPNIIKWDNSLGGGLSATVFFSTSGAQTAGPFVPEEGSGVGTPNPGKGQAFSGILRYQGGPLSVGGGFFKASPEDGNAADTGEQSATRVWAGYSFGMISVALGFDKSEIKPTGERTAIALPVKITSGNDTFMLKYAMADDRDATGGGTVASSGAKMFGVGWDHALGKRTVIGVHYTSLDNDAAAAYQFFARGASGTTLAAAGEDATQLYLGIAHFY